MTPGSPDEDAQEATGGVRPGRLTKHADFGRAARGRRVSAGTFILQSRRREGPEPPVEGARVGFTVTKKIGNAVVRNCIRRRLKEALRAAWPLEAPADRDYVLVARREALTRPFDALIGDLRHAFLSVPRGEGEGRGRTSATVRDRDRRK